MTEKKYFAPSFPLISIFEKKVERLHQFKNDRENAYLIAPRRSFPTFRMTNVTVIKSWEYKITEINRHKLSILGSLKKWNPIFCNFSPFLIIFGPKSVPKLEHE